MDTHFICLLKPEISFRWTSLYFFFFFFYKTRVPDFVHFHWQRVRKWVLQWPVWTGESCVSAHICTSLCVYMCRIDLKNCEHGFSCLTPPFLIFLCWNITWPHGLLSQLLPLELLSSHQWNTTVVMGSCQVWIGWEDLGMWERFIEHARSAAPDLIFATVHLRRTCIHHATCKHRWAVEVHAGFSLLKLGPLEKTTTNIVVTQPNCLLKVLSAPFHMAGDAHEWFPAHDKSNQLISATSLVTWHESNWACVKEAEMH